MEITLTDGKEYTFKCLPFCKRSVKIMEDLETKPVPTLLDAIVFSLTLTYGREKAEEIIESGVIPFPKVGNPIIDQITASLFPTDSDG